MGNEVSAAARRLVERPIPLYRLDGPVHPFSAELLRMAGDLTVSPTELVDAFLREAHPVEGQSSYDWRLDGKDLTRIVLSVRRALDLAVAMNTFMATRSAEMAILEVMHTLPGEVFEDLDANDYACIAYLSRQLLSRSGLIRDILEILRVPVAVVPLGLELRQNAPKSMMIRLMQESLAPLLRRSDPIIVPVVDLDHSHATVVVICRSGLYIVDSNSGDTAEHLPALLASTATKLGLPVKKMYTGIQGDEEPLCATLSVVNAVTIGLLLHAKLPMSEISAFFERMKLEDIYRRSLMKLVLRTCFDRFSELIDEELRNLRPVQERLRFVSCAEVNELRDLKPGMLDLIKTWTKDLVHPAPPGTLEAIDRLDAMHIEPRFRRSDYTTLYSPAEPPSPPSLDDVSLKEPPAS